MITATGDKTLAFKLEIQCAQNDSGETDAAGGGRFLEKLRIAADDFRQSDAGDCVEEQ
jgi:hypothetical protein